MSNLRTAAQQALEALEQDNPAGRTATITALKAALAEPVQEPVAWGLFAKVEDGTFNLQHPVRFTEDDAEADQSMYEHGTQIRIHALYTAPPQRKPPATIDEMFDRMNKAPRGVFSGRDLMTIWMEAWRAAEQHHGIKEKE
jgi:hypothetical protein